MATNVIKFHCTSCTSHTADVRVKEAMTVKKEVHRYHRYDAKLTLPFEDHVRSQVRKNRNHVMIKERISLAAISSTLIIVHLGFEMLPLVKVSCQNMSRLRDGVTVLVC